MQYIPLLRRFFWRARLALGEFDEFKHIDPERIECLVFVCRGNVCRSPYAEAAAKALGYFAISCGAYVCHSAPAELMAARAAILRGKDISKHMSRSILDLQIKSTDCLVAMDPSVLSVSRGVASRTGCQVTLIGLWGDPPVGEVEDPYGMPLNAFVNCYDKIDKALDGLLKCIEEGVENRKIELKKRKR